MDVIAAVKFYLNRMVEDCGVGMKVLLMDKETTSIVSMVFAQSEMLQKEVYLFERIGTHNKGDAMKFLKCLVFLRPTAENIELLRMELKSPRFGTYHIYFSNIISKSDIKILAEADEQELVKDVQEFYSDFIAVSPHLFSVNTSGCFHGLSHWNSSAFNRTTSGIISVLLALRKCPAIRYQASSDMCKRLAESIRQTIAKEGSLFDFRKTPQDSGTPVLLLIDRKFDLITPCLNQWTYQAMLHELLTITNNRVNLAEVPGITKDLKEVVLSQEHDEFYEKNMYLNYGEIGANIKQLMEEFQMKTKSQQKVETISDMKAFIDNYPQFKKMSGTVSKHVTLIGELSRLVSSFNLFEISEAEQELACHSDHSESLKKIKTLLANPKVRDIDALRLCVLYALRFQRNSNNDIHGLIELLKRKGLGDRQIKVIHQILDFSGRQSSNTSDLLTTENVKAFSKKLIKGLKGVENIYTQHTPHLEETVRELARGRLKEVQFPYLGTLQLQEKPQEIIVFIVGGATFEESFAVYQLNRSLNDTKVLLGTTSIHNFKSFLEELRQASTSSTTASTSTRSRIL